MVNEHSVINKCQALYSAFNEQAINRLADIYHSDVVFTDPIHKVEGIGALKQYFKHICEGSDSRFDFTATVIQNHQAFLRWTMHYSHPKLANGKALVLSGGSFLTIDEPTQRIIAQEDYYDMGKMIYRHIPVLGWAVQKINSNLTGANVAGGKYPGNDHAQ